MNFGPLTIVLGALLRSIIGWAKHSLEDGKINSIEWKQLVATVIRVGFFGALIAFFPNIDLSWADITVGALITDLVYNNIQKLIKSLKK